MVSLYPGWYMGTNADILLSDPRPGVGGGGGEGLVSF